MADRNIIIEKKKNMKTLAESIRKNKKHECLVINLEETEWEMLAEAIEKQIPKKPVYEQFWLCPNCKAEIYWDTDYGQQHFKYCPYCGQAIDWSDDNE